MFKELFEKLFNKNCPLKEEQCKEFDGYLEQIYKTDYPIIHLKYDKLLFIDWTPERRYNYDKLVSREIYVKPIIEKFQYRLDQVLINGPLTDNENITLCRALDYLKFYNVKFEDAVKRTEL